MIGALTALAIVTLHLQVAQVGGFPLTLGALLGIGLVVFLASPLRIPLVPFIFVLGLIALGCFGFLANPSGVSGEDYFRTFALVVMSATLVVISLPPSTHSDQTWRGMERGVIVAVWVVSVMSLVQVVTGYLGSEVFFNPWGAFQYLYEYKPYLQWNPIPRAQGFYLEPSFDAFVLGSMLFILLVRRRANPATVIVTVGGLLAARSATSIVILLLLLGMYAIVSHRSLYGAAALIAVIVVTWGELMRRVSSIFDLSSSGNYRLIAPLRVLEDVVFSSPLGSPLGSVETVLRQYDLLNGSRAGTSLDNGIYLLVFYFGWAGVLLVAILAVAAIYAVRNLSRRGVGFGAYAPAWVLGSLVFSGGIFLPEYIVVVCLLLLSIGRLDRKVQSGPVTPFVRSLSHL